MCALPVLVGSLLDMGPMSQMYSFDCCPGLSLTCF